MTTQIFQLHYLNYIQNLEEAWINVVNVDIEGTGAMSGKTYTLKSAPCGATAEYCLAADGYPITMANMTIPLTGFDLM